MKPHDFGTCPREQRFLDSVKVVLLLLLQDIVQGAPGLPLPHDQRYFPSWKLKDEVSAERLT